MTNYNIQRMQVSTTQCAQMPPEAQYFVAYQQNTNNQFLIIGRAKMP